MGVFFDQVEIVNRTSGVLHLRYDGQDFEIQPNYTATGERIPDVRNMIPAITVPYAKSQNVLMGSEDPHDPSGYEVLVGVVAAKGAKQKDDISYLEQSNEPTRVKLEDYLDDPKAKVQVSGRKIRASEARPEREVQPFNVRAS